MKADTQAKAEYDILLLGVAWRCGRMSGSEKVSRISYPVSAVFQVKRREKQEKKKCLSVTIDAHCKLIISDGIHRDPTLF